MERFVLLISTENKIWIIKLKWYCQHQRLPVLPAITIMPKCAFYGRCYNPVGIISHKCSVCHGCSLIVSKRLCRCNAALWTSSNDQIFSFALVNVQHSVSLSLFFSFLFSRAGNAKQEPLLEGKKTSWRSEAVTHERCWKHVEEEKKTEEGRGEGWDDGRSWT